MALLDTLRTRTARKNGTAQVDCGELGVLTVEALPPAECVRLAKEPRALLYAACRELQTSGEVLRKEGLVFRPDEILVYLTDREVEKAAQAVLELSGVSENHAEDLSESRLLSVQQFTQSENRREEIRPQSVQQFTQSENRTEEIRLLSVQPLTQSDNEYGQDSHEFFPDAEQNEILSRADRKSQILGDLSAGRAQIVGSEIWSAEKGHQRESFGNDPLHETTSDLHEIRSDLKRRGKHETESEFPETGQQRVHEIESESRERMHEIKSELQIFLHETKSELAEEAARVLAEALLRAAQVR